MCRSFTRARAVDASFVERQIGIILWRVLRRGAVVRTALLLWLLLGLLLLQMLLMVLILLLLLLLGLLVKGAQLRRHTSKVFARFRLGCRELLFDLFLAGVSTTTNAVLSSAFQESVLAHVEWHTEAVLSDDTTLGPVFALWLENRGESVKSATDEFGFFLEMLLRLILTKLVVLIWLVREEGLVAGIVLLTGTILALVVLIQSDYWNESRDSEVWLLVDDSRFTITSVSVLRWLTKERFEIQCSTTRFVSSSITS